MSLIEIKGMSYAYKKRDALKDFSMTLEEGHVVGLLGTNGAGKTSLIKILAGVIGGYEGSVLIDGSVPGAATKAKVAYLPERSSLDESLTPRQLIRCFDDFFEDFEPDTAERNMKIHGLPLDRKLNKMSKGMRDKVQIILTMARRARLYLLDEPGTGVDLLAKDLMLKSIIERYREDALILICTHRIADFEPILDQAVFMKEGKMIRLVETEDLRIQHGISLEEGFRRLCGGLPDVEGDALPPEQEVLNA